MTKEEALVLTLVEQEPKDHQQVIMEVLGFTEYLPCLGLDIPEDDPSKIPPAQWCEKHQMRKKPRLGTGASFQCSRCKGRYREA